MNTMNTIDTMEPDGLKYFLPWVLLRIEKTKRNLAMNEMHYSNILYEDRIFELRCILN